MNARHDRYSTIMMTIAAAVVLTLLPLPPILDLIRPYWVALVIIYWGLETQDHISLGLAFSIGILLDLQGPKIRVGRLTGGEVHLGDGAELRLELSEAVGTAEKVSLPHPEVFEALNPGMTLLLDDGKLRLEVIDCGPDYAEAKVTVGGPLRDRESRTSRSRVLVFRGPSVAERRSRGGQMRGITVTASVSRKLKGRC